MREERKDGKVEGWKNGRAEERTSEGVAGGAHRPPLSQAHRILRSSMPPILRPVFQSSNLPPFHPLVVEVPGPEGPSGRRSGLLDLIREAVGIKV